jgi:hypothetical protein
VNFALSQKVRGVVIPTGGAQIVILERPENVSDLERWVGTTTIGAETISNKDVSIDSIAVRGGLRALEVGTESGVSPDRFQDIGLYFEISGRGFRGLLTYWKGDPKASEYLRVLHEIAGSLTASEMRRVRGQPYTSYLGAGGSATQLRYAYDMAGRSTGLQQWDNQNQVWNAGASNGTSNEAGQLTGY